MSNLVWARALAPSEWAISLDHLGGYETVQALKKGDLPSADFDSAFGGFISNCWREGYETMAQLKETITSTLKDCRSRVGSNVMEPKVFEARVVECVHFLEKEGKPAGPDSVYATAPR